ncbi:MAG TPA: malto-oligosyltrehalose synthase [Dermatophilaceae bacterium]|nr:malto-oligosyltrehalose synthase [Dermatophilaceae bacterium]
MNDPAGMPAGSVGAHRPGPGRPVPVSTYRLQVHGDFGFDDAAEQTAYLASLGVTHLYLSPILQPAPGSRHGYDVVDHGRLNDEAGGRAAFDRLVAAAHAAGLGVVVDVVPNHMTVPTPTHLNRALWDVLRRGQESPFASWFDVEWQAEGGRLLMPVLGGPLASVLGAGELSVAGDGGADGDEPVLRYYDHEFPLRPGTEGLPVEEAVGAQAYRLSDWREAATDLNYRRFFDVTTLIAVQVEDPAVFDATHALLRELHRAGAVDGLRIDHPDGLADPGGYLARLAEVTGGAWVVAEKILEGEEELPASWRCAGTTGYDALLRVQQVLTDARGVATLDRLWAERAPGEEDLDTVVTTAKQLVVERVQGAEVNRLLRLVERLGARADPEAVRRALLALLVGMDRYRAYLVPGSDPDPDQLAVLESARERAADLLDRADHQALAEVTALVRGEGAATDDGRPPAVPAGGERSDVQRELMVRFQQTCGPVMAKGIEDTAFYRWFRLAGANEVGGDPAHLAIDAADFHDHAASRLASWPTTLTTLTTHDTKRAEDVRARLAALAERADDWADWVPEAERLVAGARGSRVDRPTEYLLWQTLVGAWPLTDARLAEYLLKAVREAKLHTAWVDGDPAYEDEVVALGRAALGDPAVAAHVERWLAATSASARAFTLGQKLLQLTMPGVADVYQGTELTLLALVDPDNRRPVDYGDRAARLARLDAGAGPADLDDEKLLVTSRALRLRRDHPQWFVGEQATYAGVPSDSPHAVALARGDGSGPAVLAVATRAATTLAEAGGWGETALGVPAGRWRDLLTGAEVASGPGGCRLGDLLAALPVALLVRTS